MRWEVQGAEAATGKETTLTIEAATSEDAEQQARYNGVLVSQVRKATGTKPKAAAVHAFDKPVPPSTTPDYREIVNGAKLVRLFGGLMNALGVTVIIIGVLGAVAYLITVQRDSGRIEPTDFGSAAGIAVFAVVSSLIYLAGGAVLKMFAAMAEAVRDIARNSFRR